MNSYNRYCILPIDKYNNFIKNLYKDKFKYIGVYPIKFNNKTIGILHICYKNKVEFPIKNNSFSLTFSKQLGAIINNYLLTEKLTSEFFTKTRNRKRIIIFLDTALI